jgi:hypothetical protein
MPCVRRYTVTWYRRRGQLGLISPWQTDSSIRYTPQPQQQRLCSASCTALLAAVQLGILWLAMQSLAAPAPATVICTVLRRGKETHAGPSEVVGNLTCCALLCCVGAGEARLLLPVLPGLWTPRLMCLLICWLTLTASSLMWTDLWCTTKRRHQHGAVSVA